MKRRRGRTPCFATRFLSLLLLLMIPWLAIHHAQQAADLEITFPFGSPMGVAIDLSSRALVVASDKIYFFPSVDTFASSSIPPSPLTEVGAPGLLINSTVYPTNAFCKGGAFTGITLDKKGNLWASDVVTPRVLLWQNAQHSSSGSRAKQVLGQPSFTSSGSGSDGQGLNGPSGKERHFLFVFVVVQNLI